MMAINNYHRVYGETLSELIVVQERWTRIFTFKMSDLPHHGKITIRINLGLWTELIPGIGGFTQMKVIGKVEGSCVTQSVKGMLSASNQFNSGFDEGSMVFHFQTEIAPIPITDTITNGETWQPITFELNPENSSGSLDGTDMHVAQGEKDGIRHGDSAAELIILPT